LIIIDFFSNYVSDDQIMVNYFLVYFILSTDND